MAYFKIEQCIGFTVGDDIPLHFSFETCFLTFFFVVYCYVQSGEGIFTCVQSQPCFEPQVLLLVLRC